MPPPSSIAFVSLPPRVGVAVTRTVTQESDLTLAPTMPDGTTATIEYSSRSAFKRREEPLRVDNDVCVRQQVSYLSDHSETNVEGRIEEIENPVTGRTFIIERRRDGRNDLQVFEPSGIPSLAVDESVVARDYPRFGTATHFQPALPSTPQTVGSTAPGLLRTLVQGLGGPHQIVESAMISLAAIHVEGTALVGEFAFTARVKLPSPEAVVRLDLSGTMFVRSVDAEVSEFSMRGPMIVEPTPGSGNAPAAGEFRFTEKRTYH